MRKAQSSLGPALIVLLVAAFARIYLFGDAPPGLQHDEIFKAQEGRLLIEAGDFRLFYPSNQGHEGAFVWLLGVSYMLFGTSVMMVKFPAFVCGMLTVALSYRVSGEIFNRRVAFITAGLTAVSFWGVYTSRVGLRAVMLPVIALLVIWGLWRLTQVRRSKTMQWRTALLTGSALGFAIYTYTSSFALYLAAGLFGLALIVWQRDMLRARWRQLALVVTLGVLIALPMLVIRLTDPQGQNRVSTITRPWNDFRAGQPGELIDNFWGLAGMAYFTGDPEWRYNVAGRPIFATPVGLLVYVGLLVAIWRTREKPILAMFIGVATFGLIPSLLTVSAPSFLRSIIAMPAVMLFIALAIDLIPNRRLVWIVGTLAVGITAMTDWPAYFSTWIHNDEVYSIYRDDLEQLAAYLHAQDEDLALISTDDVRLDPLILPYYQPPDRTTTAFFDGSTNIALSQSPALLLISPGSQITPPHADWLTVANGTEQLAPVLRQDGQIAYEVYRLTDTSGAVLTERLESDLIDPVYLHQDAEFPRGAIENWAESIDYPVNFGNLVQLVGVNLSDRAINTERDGVNIQLYFEPLVDHVQLPLNVFVHMSRRDGTVHAQRDLLGMPSIEWDQRLIFMQDNFVIAGPTPPERYFISVGIYNFETRERLAIFNSAGENVGDRVLVGRVRVVADE